MVRIYFVYAFVNQRGGGGETLREEKQNGCNPTPSLSLSKTTPSLATSLIAALLSAERSGNSSGTSHVLAPSFLRRFTPVQVELFRSSGHGRLAPHLKHSVQRIFASRAPLYRSQRHRLFLTVVPILTIYTGRVHVFPLVFRFQIIAVPRTRDAMIIFLLIVLD